MKLLDKIKTEAIKALKKGDRFRLSVLRVLLAEIKNREIAKRPRRLEEKDVKDAIAKEIKDREEGIRIYKGANVVDRVELLEQEIKILREFLPLMGDEEIHKIIYEGISLTGASTIKDIGKVLGFVMPKVRGQADPKHVKSLIVEKLSAEKLN